MEKWLGQDIPKLGFGMMRLPTLPDGAMDMAQINEMVDAYIGKGFTYFDTAYGYMGERSEDTVRQAVVERYPRDAIQVATKLPLWEIKEAEDMERLFSTQLKRTGAGYFDFYLLHSVNSHILDTLDRVDAWKFIRDKKAAGLAKHIGFSFHDSAALLDKVLGAHPEFEFVQLQVNYADWESENVQARECYEVALKYGKSVIIMEPVKGGALAKLSDKAQEAFTRANPNVSFASWAMRYAASLDRVVTVLSGMSNMEQMLDNIKTFSPFEPLTEADRAVIAEVQQILLDTPTIACTNCKYCTEQCPSNIAIPGILRAENYRRTYGVINHFEYNQAIKDKGKASDCIKCGLCEARCPQKLEIISLLEETIPAFEG
ncbi:MAG: aldo/keto reductase [Oscillospiraceae bacterium]|jgi:predicted aldo/keto reductase-like oxidoreductase|nr:aldo/keto reductase [Oscillospiraceae bacterium]